MALVTAEEEPAGVGWMLFTLALLAQIEHGGGVEQALPLFERASALQGAAGLPVSQARIDVLNCRQLVLADRIDDELVRRLDAADRVLRAARDPDVSSVDTARLELADAFDDVDGIVSISAELLRDGAEGERITSEAYIGLAHAHRLRGDLHGAQRELLRALQIEVDRSDLLYAGVTLQSLAALAARCDHPAEAARLWGAGTLYSAEWPLFRRKNGPLLERVRATLGDRFDEEAAVGRAMSLDELQTLAAFDLGDGHAPPDERSSR
jgi:hypothetical protein